MSVHHCKGNLWKFYVVRVRFDTSCWYIIAIISYGCYYFRQFNYSYKSASQWHNLIQVSCRYIITKATHGHPMLSVARFDTSFRYIVAIISYARLSLLLFQLIQPFIRFMSSLERQLMDSSKLKLCYNKECPSFPWTNDWHSRFLIVLTNFSRVSETIIMFMFLVWLCNICKSVAKLKSSWKL